MKAIWLFCLIIGTIGISGCVPNQKAFEKQMHDNVYAGMAKRQALLNFEKLHMKCMPAAAKHEVGDPIVNDGEPINGNSRLSCSRSRQPALPATCVERVDVDIDPNGIVKNVDVNQIICAGL
jgi:hypothetical protein